MGFRSPGRSGRLKRGRLAKARAPRVFFFNVRDGNRYCRLPGGGKGGRPAMMGVDVPDIVGH
jgi:hypothetical protein